MKTSHERLTEERLRLGYGQGEFAALGGVGRGPKRTTKRGCANRTWRISKR